ncbi:MAG: bile acid:sodium symporter family protein, partial [Calditrichales bacterium]
MFSTGKKIKVWKQGMITAAVFMMVYALIPVNALAQNEASLKVYQQLSDASKGKGDPALFETLNVVSRQLSWDSATNLQFKGNLRMFKMNGVSAASDKSTLFFVRQLDGKVYILSRPTETDDRYAGLEDMIQNKMVFNIESIDETVGGTNYHFARFVEKPSQAFLDKIFKISIVLMLFFVMVGMGLTLTRKDFAIVFSKPKGMLLGEILQFGVMPLIAVGLGYVMGFREHYPYIFVGMVLIAATPGGVTSNLMTHYAKGDVALSISLTSISTVLSIIFVPLLLSAYCSNIPEVIIPVNMITSTIIVLVIIPLAIGMLVRAKWENFAKKSIKVFSILGIIALLFLIIAGISSNLDKFADTERYGLVFYIMVFIFTLGGMVAGVVIPRLFGVSNFQTRAISLETGLRNSSLAMAVALLIQDSMGDFYSSLFFVSAIFGLTMYLAGL